MWFRPSFKVGKGVRPIRYEWGRAYHAAGQQGRARLDSESIFAQDPGDLDYASAWPVFPARCE